MNPFSADDPRYYTFAVIELCSVSFLAFFLGVFIRKFALPSRKSPPLHQLLLLSIPVSLVVVAPFIIIVPASISELPKTLLTLGIIMEHGMIVPEMVSAHLRQLLKEPTNDVSMRRSA